jgi:hypothetical protein
MDPAAQKEGTTGLPGENVIRKVNISQSACSLGDTVEHAA